MVDFNEAMDFDIPDELVPSGTYPLVCKTAKGEQGPKAPYIALLFEIASGELKGTPLYHNITLSTNRFARTRAKAAFEAILGREIKKASISALCSALPGCVCRGVVGQGEYEGEQRPELRRFLPKADDKLFAEEADLDEIPF